MGLFSRKNKDADLVQQELQVLKERLQAAERAKADLEHRVRVLDDAHQTLIGQITSLDATTAKVDQSVAALSGKVVAVGDQVSILAASNSLLTERVESLDGIDAQLRDLTDRAAAVDALEERLRDLTDRIERPPASPPPPSPPAPPAPPAAPAPPPPVADDRLDLLADRVAELAERLSTTDERITGVSTELANQLTELGRDIDELHQRQAEQAAAPATDTSGAAGAVAAEIEARLTERIDEAVDDLLDVTERLAAEQARYEIQFRADLAELADRLRRPRP